MRTSNSDRLTAAAAEQLLDGGAGPARLQQLLAAAAGPAAPSELAGEAAALAAFADAPRASPLAGAASRAPSVGPSTFGDAVSRILAAKAVAGVVLLAGATGGVALAASAASPAAPPADRPSVTGTPLPTPASVPTSAPEEGSAPGTRTTRAATTVQPPPQPSLAGLCDTWAAGSTDNPGAAEENPAFGALVEAAGSSAGVPAHCAGLADDSVDRADSDRHDRPGPAPGQDGEAPHGPPTDAPGTARQNGLPPTAAPGNPEHPAGPPADVPGRGGNGSNGTNGGNGADGTRDDGAPSERAGRPGSGD